MADFSEKVTNMPFQGQEVKVPEPVHTQAVNTSMLDFVSSAADTFFKYSANSAKADKEAAKNAALQGYSQSQEQINQAVATGQMKPNEAFTRSQRLYSQTIAGNSQFASDITQIYKGFQGGSELEGVDDEVKLQREARKSLYVKAQADGIPLRKGMDPDLEASMLSAYQDTLASQQKLDREMKLQDHQMRVADFDDKRIKEARKDASFQAISSVAASHIDISDAFIKDSIARVGQNPAEAENIKSEVVSHFAKIKAVITAQAGTDPTLAGSYTQIFNDLEKTALGLLDPNKSSNELKRQLEDRVNAAKLLITNDPKVLGYAAASSLFGSNSSLMLEIAKVNIAKVLEMAQSPSGGYAAKPDMITDATSQKDLVKHMGSVFDMLNKGLVTNPDKASTEARNIVSNSLDQLSTALSKGIPAKEIKPIMEMIASDKFGNYVKTNGLSQKDVDALGKSIATYYLPQFTQSVSSTWDSFLYQARYTKGAQGAPRQVSDAISIQFNGAGISFSPKSEMSNDPVEQDSVREAAKTLTAAQTATNNYLHAIAHLEGTSDYAATWEKHKYSMFPRYYPVKPGKVYEGAILDEGKEAEWADRRNWKPANAGSK